MNDNFDKEKFKQYFHYGLEYKEEDILDEIIMRSSKIVYKMNFEKVNTDMNELEYTIDMAKNLYAQFVRFINLTDGQNKNWYKNVTKDTVSDTVMQRINKLNKDGLISVVTYDPLYGIYVNDRGGSRIPDLTGLQRYENIPKWIKDDIFPILMYLAETEEKNLYQYNSLFLDTKYARSINSTNCDSMKKIESIYKTFLENAKPAKEDIYSVLGKNISRSQKEYIENNYADYWTITDLKEQVKGDEYKDKVKYQCENIKLLNLKDRFDD